MTGTVDVLLPNFFIIGANKAGTTSLHRYVAQHPDVYMSPVKEPMFFAPEPPEVRRDDPAWRATNRAQVIENLEEYRALFAGADGERVRGESSTAYLSKPQTPPLIKAAVPDAKLVAVLRNPSERAFSAYAMHRQWGVEPLSFADAVSAELDSGVDVGRKRIYVKLGYYGRFLSRYLEHFDRGQIQIHLYEDLIADPIDLVHEVLTFLDVDPAFTPDLATRYNVTQYEPRSRAVDRFARARAVKTIAYRFLPERGLARARELLRRRNSVVPEFPDDVRRRLVDLYREDILLTQEIVGRDLSSWLT